MVNIDNQIIHIFDDQKFIDPAIKLFETTIPNLSLYFVLVPNNKKFKFVKSSIVTPIIICDNEDILNFSTFICDIKAKVVFFHALDRTKQRLVDLLPKKIVKVWFIWGYDFYCNWNLLNKNLYEKETSKYLDKKINVKNLIKENEFSFLLFKKTNKYNIYILSRIKRILANTFSTPFYKTIQKIDIVVPIIPNEYEMLNKIGINSKFAPFNYVCIEEMLGSLLNENVLNSNDILIGNSADPSNNHLDVFLKLSKFKLKGKKIIVPLNYGGDKKYIESVIEKGKFYFGGNFIPLLNFMPLEEYNKIILNCGFVIMNHRRQQAVANIISMGYLGAKIFLNKKSPVYKYYKDIGIKIYELDKLNELMLESNLIKDAYINNKNIYFKYYSRSAVVDKIKKLIEITNLEIKLKN